MQLSLFIVKYIICSQVGFLNGNSFFKCLHSQFTLRGLHELQTKSKKGTGTVILSVLVFIVSHIDTATFNMLIACRMFS